MKLGLSLLLLLLVLCRKAGPGSPNTPNLSLLRLTFHVHIRSSHHILQHSHSLTSSSSLSIHPSLHNLKHQSTPPPSRTWHISNSSSIYSIISINTLFSSTILSTSSLVFLSLKLTIFIIYSPSPHLDFKFSLCRVVNYNFGGGGGESEGSNPGRILR